MTKFDHIIMNPPYNRNLHLKILNEVIKHSDDVVNLSPVRWLQDPLAEYKKNSDFKKFKDIRDHIDSLEVISAKDGSSMFGVGFTMNIGIYHITPNGGYSYTPNFLIQKIVNTGHIGIPTTTFKNCNAPYFCLLKTVDGAAHVDRGQTMDGYILRKETHYGKYFNNGISTNGKTLHQCKLDNKMCTNGNENTWRVVPFNSEIEVQNFYEFTKTKFVRWVYIHECVGTGSPNTNFLPWMKDYTHPWTDEMLYEYFKLTPEEIQIIENEFKDEV